MRAIVVDEPGGPEVLRLEDAPEAHRAIEKHRTSGKVLLTVR